MLGEKLSREGGNVMMEIHTMRRCQQRLQLQVRISKRHLAVVSCLMSHASCLMPHVSRRGQGQDHGQGQGRIRGRGYLGDLCGIAAENL